MDRERAVAVPVANNRVSAALPLVSHVLILRGRTRFALGGPRMSRDYSGLPVAIVHACRGQIRHRPGCPVLPLCFGLLLGQAGWAQAPQITAAGVVNAASYAQPIAPGSIVSIFGTNLASTTATAPGTPLPTLLAGTSVTMNGTKAPLFFVSPGQINLQAPWELQSALDPSGSEFRSATVVVSTPSGPSAPVQVTIYGSAPGIFSLDASGCGRAAALNVAVDGSVSLNSPSNSAALGDYVSVYGTAFGLLYFPPPDGVPAAGAQQTIIALGVSLDGQPLAGYWYQGVAPGLVGGNQINFQIPSGTREGCAVPITVNNSPALSISIHSGRGQCVDPPTQSYGQVMLTKTVTTGTANDGESDTFSAVFPSGPGLKSPPLPAPPTYAGTYYFSGTPVPVSRSCPVASYTDLSAGTIQVQDINAGTSIAAQPISQTGGVAYQQVLPAGFIAPGPYNISASGGPVTFRAGLSVDSPIQIQTPLPPGTTISSSQPLTVKWTGGAPGYLVKVTLAAGPGFNRNSDYAYADAASGQFTFFPYCTGEGQNPFARCTSQGTGR